MVTTIRAATVRPSTLDNLTQRTTRLVKEQDDLRYHHSELLAYGIGSQTAEVLERIRDIKAEIRELIARTQRSIGSTQEVLR